MEKGKIRRIFIVSTLVLFLGLSYLLAKGSISVVNQKVSAVSQLLHEKNFRLNVDLSTVFLLEKGRLSAYNVYLYRGVCYAIVGVADETVIDLDLIVFDSSMNNEIVKDQDRSEVAVVTFCPRYSGNFKIGLGLYDSMHIDAYVASLVGE